MKPPAKDIPNNPGCYLFLDGSYKILYVGKAKNLKKRVASYFNKQPKDPKTKAMLSSAKNIDFIVTSNEVEALILENNLIKKNTPKYNIDLKDSKRYAYLEIPDEKFPRLLLARKIKSQGKLFGPFTSAQKRDYVKDLLTKTFKIRTCNKFPKKACLRYHLDLCDAPCVGGVSEEKYMENIKSAEFILKGKIKNIIKSLNKKMKNASKNQEYERALELRNQIGSVKWLNEKQNMERQKKYNEDIINYVRDKDKVYLMLFNISSGMLENKKDFEFEYNEEFLSEFIIQYYSENKIPAEVILPEKIDDSIVELLTKLRKKKVKVVVPEMGEKKQLLDLVKKNIEIHFFGELEKLEGIRKELKLEEIPNVIECFDISHLGGTNTVASMVQFRNGNPDKTNYRRFKLKTVVGIDDYASISEVIRRRYYKLIKNKEAMPNLIMVDGGAPQLGAAMIELKELGLKIPVIGLAKREEEIYLPDGGILKLGKKNLGLLMLIAIRNEAHRFAIKYNRLLRSKGVFD